MPTEESSEDVKDIALAHQYRISLEAPPQSRFRVVAVVYLDGVKDSQSSSSSIPFPSPLLNSVDSRHYVVGANDEPGYIGGSICAERSALVQLRFLPGVRVNKIVIVTDSHSPISPGMLCREFMAGHSAVPWDVPILLAGSLCRCCGLDLSKNHESLEEAKAMISEESCPKATSGNDCHHCFDMLHTTLRALYPHPSCYSRLDAGESVRKGEAFQHSSSSSSGVSGNDKSTDTEPSLLELSTQEMHEKLLQLAQQAASLDERTDLHPIQFGAAVIYNDGRTQTAHQKKALEYGSTLDAVSQLATHLVDERSGSDKPILIVQADQYGIAHAPFAQARAFLSEHGYGSCEVLLHEFSSDGISKLVCVPVSELAPTAPDMGKLWVD